MPVSDFKENDSNVCLFRTIFAFGDSLKRMMS